jgi:hypothetical protein
MDLLLDSRVIGSKDHLLVSDDGFLRVSKRPADVWHYSGDLKDESDKCWDSVLRLSSRQMLPQIPKKYSQAMRVVAPPDVTIPWSQVLPQEVYRKYLNKLVSLRGEYDESALSYYSSVWVRGSELLRRMRPAKTDGMLVDSIVNESVHNSSVVSTFRPRGGGYAPVVSYDRFGTVTGRLVVSSGPNILLLKKEHRNMLRPSTPGGMIVSMDFSSLEARILLYESGGRCDSSDLYTDIADRLGGIPRNVVKGAILAELYGSSKYSLALSLGLSDSALEDFIKRIGEVIDTRKLLSRLKAQFTSVGHITNKYGRRLEVSRPQDNIFINYYAQSTGVDVSLMGFNEVLNALGPEGIRPLFVLHDALILDVREDRINDVFSVKDVSVPGFEPKFPLKCETL